MSFILSLYIANFLLLIFLGVTFLKKYFHLTGAYFFIFSIATGCWFILYLLTYFGSANLDYLILFAQLSYATSLISLYSFLFFLYFFPRKKRTIIHSSLIAFVCISLLLLWFYSSTPYIVEDLYFHQLKQDWYESEGILFGFHMFLSLLFLPLGLFLGYTSLRQARYIEKKRLQYILIGFLIFVGLSFIFLLILPKFGFWALEKYIALFFLPFVFGVIYATRRYEFLNIKIAFTYLLGFFISLLSTYVFLLALEGYLAQNFSQSFQAYWGIGDRFLLVELAVSILIFLGILSCIKYKILPHIQSDQFGSVLERIKLEIPYITTIEKLNLYLASQFQSRLNISHFYINTQPESNLDYILQYFQKNIQKKYFIHDIVFLEENKNKFGDHGYTQKNDSAAYIIFALRDSDDHLLATVEIGAKSLDDPYYVAEIQELEKLVLFLQGHLKYLSVYEKMQRLSISLDKQVDEKTIEYNNLINKQKEFIAFVGHEIKNPLTNCIFLCDSIRDDFGDNFHPGRAGKLQEDIDILYGELIKVSDLVKHIFSTEQFDLQKVRLYTTPQDIGLFLQAEISVFISRYPDVFFESRIGDLGNRDIDITQFRQVIHNLITNAVKFSGKISPKVCISADIGEKNTIIISIEDNGAGLGEDGLVSIFDKYVTGNTSSIGLGMGLYLCKKIVELHRGQIRAEKSTHLGGAKFTIIL